MTRSWLVAALCIGLQAVGFLADQGCTAATTSTAGDAGLDASAAAPAFGSCASCLYGECVNDFLSCANDATCARAYRCATLGACEEAGAPDSPTYLALVSCEQAAECLHINASATCAGACVPAAPACTESDAGSSSSEPAEGGGDAGALSCAECQFDQCAAQRGACAPGTPCAAWVQCTLTCASSASASTCAALAAGADAAAAFASCIGASCPQCE